MRCLSKNLLTTLSYIEGKKALSIDESRDYSYKKSEEALRKVISYAKKVKS